MTDIFKEREGPQRWKKKMNVLLTITCKLAPFERYAIKLWLDVFGYWPSDLRVYWLLSWYYFCLYLFVDTTSSVLVSNDSCHQL